MPWKRKRILISTPLSSFSRLFAFFRKIISHVIFKMIGLDDKDKDVATKVPRTYPYNRYIIDRDDPFHYANLKAISFSQNLSPSPSHTQKIQKQDRFFVKLWLLLFSLYSFSHLNTFSIIPHLFFSKQGDNFLSTDLRSLPKISRKLSSIDRSSICLFSRVEKFAVSFFSLHTSFSFYFRNFPRAESLGGRFGGGSRSIWFIGGRRSLPRAEDCNFEAGGGAFRTAFRRHFRPTPRLLLLNVPSPPPPSARPSPLIAFIAPLSSDTFARKSFLIDNRRLATSVSGECFSPNCVSTNVDCVFDSLPCGQISRSR